MYNIERMTLRDMSECGLALRHLGDNASSMEEAANNIIQHLYKAFIGSSNEQACVLVRFFKTHSYKDLTPDLQEYISEILNTRTVSDNLKCLTMLATAGDLEEWNSRHQSVGHKAIPLANEEAIARIPMISQLIQQLGINPGIVVQPNADFLSDLEQKMYNVFYIPNALNSPYIPSQALFVVPFNIKSVLGFGGLLPNGDMFAIVIFLKLFVPRTVINLFQPLALNIKLAILPFDKSRIFQENLEQSNAVIADNSQNPSLDYLNSKNFVLNQLLDVSEKSTIMQSDKLEEVIANLNQTLKDLQKTQIQLIQNEKMSSLGQMVAGIAHEINNPVSFIYGNLQYTQEYFQDLLQLISLYQKVCPVPSPEIQAYLELIDFDYLSSDLYSLIDSMRNGANRIRQIVLSLRNFSRLDESDMKQVDLHEGINNTLLILQQRLSPKDNSPQIEIVKNYAQLPLVECLAGDINQVFFHILSNAIDFIQIHYQKLNIKEKRQYTGQIQITTLTDQNAVIIQIADNGFGMTQEVQKRIFEPFLTTKEVGKGTGLGLAVCYQIITQMHQGEIICTSEIGKGSQFVLRIPLLQKKKNASR